MTDIPPGAILVCSPASSPACFADDAFSDCAECGIKLRHRPHVPEGARKVCQACAGKIIAAQEKAGDEIKVGVTTQTLRELALYFSRGRRQ